MKDKKESKKLCGKDAVSDVNVRRGLWEDMSSDLPDGAAMAMLEEFDLGIEDLE